MKLLVQPTDGVLPVIKAITGARKSVEIVIFRFDQREVERALINAVSRGVFVHALIAHTNRAGEEGLRKLEMRLLSGGVTVARTADDLVRYHDKLMIIDRQELYMLAFNYTHLDIEHSRSFGIVTRKRDLVREAVRLFEADTKRTTYEAGCDQFLVSPANARKQLTALIQSARKELLIYDPRVSDRAMIRHLEARAKAGVRICIIGEMTHKIAGVSVRRLSQMRLHTRTIVRDHNLAFVGSQSLRSLELDERREAGIVFRDPQIVSRIAQTFEEDWIASGGDVRQPAAKDSAAQPLDKVAKKVAKAVAKDLPNVAEAVNGAVKELLGPDTDFAVNSEVQEAVRDAVKTAVRQVVQGAVDDAVEQNGNGGAATAAKSNGAAGGTE